MNRLIQLGKLTRLFVIALALFAMRTAPNAFAVVPPPDGGYANFTTAEGTHALLNLTTGSGNTGLGWYSLTLDTTGSLNTAVGAASLVLNTGDSNTAVGAAAGLLITGNSNTCLGTGTGSNLTSGEGNIYIGAQVQAGAVDEQEFIRIGDDTAFAFPYDTFIAGIFDRDVAMGTARLVWVDATGKLGTELVDAAGNKVATPHAMLRQFRNQQKRIAELESTVARLAAMVREQAAQIQKVSTQLELNKPAPQTVKNAD